MKISAQLLLSIYPFLDENRLAEVLVEEGMPVSFTAGTVMMDYGTPVDFIPMLVEGEATIFIHDTVKRVDKKVYDVKPGALCSVIMLNCISGTPSEVKAICQEDITALLLPKDKAILWLGAYENCRKALMSDFSGKYKMLFRKI